MSETLTITITIVCTRHGKYAVRALLNRDGTMRFKIRIITITLIVALSAVTPAPLESLLHQRKLRERAPAARTGDDMQTVAVAAPADSKWIVVIETSLSGTNGIRIGQSIENAYGRDDLNLLDEKFLASPARNTKEKNTFGCGEFIKLGTIYRHDLLDRSEQ